MAPSRKPGPALTLAEFLPYRLNVVTQAVSLGLAQLYSDEFGISVPEWRILAALGEKTATCDQDWAGMTARDLAQHGRMGKVMVSRAVASLLDRKILSKRANRDDRREAFLRLTTRGADMYEAIVPKALAYQQSLASGISTADAKAFDRVVMHLLTSAENNGHSRNQTEPA